MMMPPPSLHFASMPPPSLHRSTSPHPIAPCSPRREALARCPSPSPFWPLYALRTEPVPSETSSSPPSPPPSPTISRSAAASHPNISNSNSTSTSILNHHLPADHPQPNQFDHLLLYAKRDPVQADHLLCSIYLQQLFQNDGSPLEDWLSESRIGDFSNSAHTILSEPSSSSSCPTTITTTNTSSTNLSHAQYHLRPSSYWHADRHSNRISPSQTQASCQLYHSPNIGASQSRETSTTSAGATSHPDHHHQRTAHPAAAVPTTHGLGPMTNPATTIIMMMPPLPHFALLLSRRRGSGG